MGFLSLQLTMSHNYHRWSSLWYLSWQQGCTSAPAVHLCYSESPLWWPLRYSGVEVIDSYVILELDSGGQLEVGQDTLAFPTGYFYNGMLCNYRIHPKEIFSTPSAQSSYRHDTGWNPYTYFGGDKNRLMHTYPWMLKYLDKRHKSIIGHHWLLLQHDHPCELVSR